MTLQATGQISLDNIRTELKATGTISLGESRTRSLAGVENTGAVQMSDFYTDSLYWHTISGASDSEGGGIQSCFTYDNRLYKAFSGFPGGGASYTKFIRLHGNSTLSSFADNFVSGKYTIVIPTEVSYRNNGTTTNGLICINGTSANGRGVICVVNPTTFSPVFYKEFGRAVGSTGANYRPLADADGGGAVSDTGGNIYIQTTMDTGVIKFNSAGTMQWNVKFNYNISGLGAVGDPRMTLDSTESTYILQGYNDISPGFRGLVLCKISSSGALQYSKFKFASGSCATANIESDNSDNILFSWRASNEAGFELGKPTYFVMLNSAGTTLWQKYPVVTGARNTGRSIIKYDSVKNFFYILLNIQKTDFTEVRVLLKINSSGVIQWAREIKTYSETGSRPRFSISGFAVCNDIISIGGSYQEQIDEYSSEIKVVSIALPGDGSLTGVYPITPPPINKAATFEYTAATVTMTDNTDLTLEAGGVSTVVARNDYAETGLTFTPSFNSTPTLIRQTLP
jgi:hypothetical protein